MTVLKTSAILLFALVVSTATLQGGVLHEDDLYELATVVAEVKVVLFEESALTGTMFYTIEIERCVKGETRATTQIVRVPKKPDAELRVAGGGKLRVGEQATLYLATAQGPSGTASYVLAMLPLHGHGNQ